MQPRPYRRGSERRLQHDHVPALIVNLDGSAIEGCAMVDISETGAQLMLREAIQIPNQFILLLSKDGKVRRHCEVVWREGKMLGIRFKQNLAGGEGVLQK